MTKQQKAAKKGWETIRARQKKRSDAAKKAWETRRTYYGPNGISF